jgi:hypothetical protein
MRFRCEWHRQLLSGSRSSVGSKQAGKNARDTAYDDVDVMMMIRAQLTVTQGTAIFLRSLEIEDFS